MGEIRHIHHDRALPDHVRIRCTFLRSLPYVGYVIDVRTFVHRIDTVRIRLHQP